MRRETVRACVPRGVREAEAYGVCTVDLRDGVRAAVDEHKLKSLIGHVEARAVLPLSVRNEREATRISARRFENTPGLPTTYTSSKSATMSVMAGKSVQSAQSR